MTKKDIQIILYLNDTELNTNMIALRLALSATLREFEIDACVIDNQIYSLQKIRKVYRNEGLRK